MITLMNFLDKIDNYLPKKSFLKFIVYYYVIIVLFFIIPMGILENVFNIESYGENPISNIEDTKTILLLTLIVGPLIETLIFQFLLIKGFYLMIENQPFNKTNYKVKILLLSILISSLIFGILHFYSLYYVIIMSILGFVFGLIFYFSTIRNWYSFFLIFILHSLYNLTVLLLEGII